MISTPVTCPEAHGSCVRKTQRTQTSFARQPADVLGKQQPDHEPGRKPRPALVAEAAGEFPVDPIPVDRTDQRH